jgi:hypothetical protein
MTKPTAFDWQASRVKDSANLDFQLDALANVAVVSSIPNQNALPARNVRSDLYNLIPSLSAKFLPHIDTQGQRLQYRRFTNRETTTTKKNC